ncbi:gonadotropin-releasing hormone receptor isoform X1 [Harpegnathos saltator]|uniref:gonadotropin-releasing hormone receptor isoform X1 n=1 Tax=Harpegnathos saltator TaxID=610380 RepID=UPI000DBEE59F|nr:gonadotropin-releasing hormone receptor isoform X1 [Harpegnathos saltator]XP_011136226.2 gonadotropin-releasing hormone receptor isoform X1 [Harpegnathos saltator]XP_011136227.2 gonadotropin-releasing hormone receptor isoform X1 [Harpegnathos saltator]XP_025153299.1 gonadotropin-releasing hormone receptor isoform X1 [Harpegnathos saltator]XP_025153300.1 gonadotropin-releasing hormone receptor isoform X1 [Harpegnathos saltator]
MEQTLGLNETEVGIRCNDMDMPMDMRFNDGHMVKIITYSILMVISATGNIAVLTMTVIRKRKSKSRINTLVMHLAIADLFVTFLMMPFEIGWSITVSWEAGDAMCRIMSFFRVFGLYLSSFVIVCISIDRYYAVMRPLQMLEIHRRGKINLMFAWLGSVLCSLPQMLVFHLEAHPKYTCYKQCITFNTFPSKMHELSYSLFVMMTMFWFPLIVIFYTYISIFVEICRRSREDRIRRSSIAFLSRARVRTLKMTITIIAVFIICWTPYYVMSIWYWADQASAREVDVRIQKALFLFACTNSCINPMIYGIFNIRQKSKTNLQSYLPLMPINATVELPVVAHARDSIFTVFLIALPILFNSPTSHNRRSSHDHGAGASSHHRNQNHAAVPVDQASRLTINTTLARSNGCI